MAPFIGRNKEMHDLNLLLRKKSASLVVIEGRRRIGKSRLADEFGKNHRFYSFSGLPPSRKTTAQDQRNEFAKQLASQFNFQDILADDWTPLFTRLAKEVSQGRCILLFDEISWMGTKDSNFLGKLKNAWDLHFKQNPELILILCGSISPWIEKNILSSTGFLGRISLIVKLHELSLRESVELLTAMGSRTNAFEKFKILGVTGGIPRYLEEIQPTLTADENIRKLCFQENGILVREFNNIFSDLFSKRSKFYKKIVEILGDGSKNFTTICERLDLRKNGHLSVYLDNLIKAGFVTRDFTWHIANGKESKLSRYRLSDNYVRFYLKYIEPNIGKIESGHFDLRSLEALSGWQTCMGFQFENLVLNNRKLIWDKLHLTSNIIVSDNPFFQKKTTQYPGCQIDYLIQTKYNTLFLCEIKFSKKPIGSAVIDSMKEKMDSLIVPKGFSKVCCLIHAGLGVDDSVCESGFFSEIIDLSELINSSNTQER